MDAISVLKAGEDSYEKKVTDDVRWGDYSATVVEPVDDLNFCTIQEYAALDVGPNPSDDRWGTWWGCTSVLVANVVCLGDFSRDGAVGPSDIGVLLAEWGRFNCDHTDPALCCGCDPLHPTIPGSVGPPAIGYLLGDWGRFDCPLPRVCTFP